MWEDDVDDALLQETLTRLLRERSQVNPLMQRPLMQQVKAEPVENEELVVEGMIVDMKVEPVVEGMADVKEELVVKEELNAAATLLALCSEVAVAPADARSSGSYVQQASSSSAGVPSTADHADALPTWSFPSGPCDPPASPCSAEEPSVDVSNAADLSDALPHQTPLQPPWRIQQKRTHSDVADHPTASRQPSRRRVRRT